MQILVYLNFMKNDTATDLRLNDLRLITAIAKHGQISLAAEALSISQPAASRTLSDIEKNIGAPVFLRHAKGMSVTELGRSLVDRANDMLVKMQDLSREIDELKRGTKGVVRVGSVAGPSIAYVVPAIKKLKSDAPFSEVHVEVNSSDVLMKGLAQGDLDFVLGRVPAYFQAENFDLTIAKTEWVKFLAHKDHPLARQKKIRLSALRKYEMVVQPKETPIRKAIEEAFFRCGVPLPNNITSTPSLMVMIASMADSTAFVPIAHELSDLLCGPQISAKLVVLDTAEQIEVAPYYFISSKERLPSPVARRLRDLVLAEIEADQDI